MTLKISDCTSLLPECCQMAPALVGNFSPQEATLLTEFMPEAKTAIVFAHHVTASLEWSWFPFASERMNNTCAADLHAQSVMKNVTDWLLDRGFAAVALPYPGRCGIGFKYVAAKTSLGELGANYLFLHRDWGPWTHLRILLTDAVFTLENTASDNSICNDCQACIAACPSGAIKVGAFDGAVCGEYMLSKRQECGVDEGFLWKCELCARVCPQGNQPRSLKISG